MPRKELPDSTRPERTIPIEVPLSHSIEMVKSLVQDELNIPIVSRSKQRLLLDRKHLLEGLSVETCIGDTRLEATLDLEDDIPIKVHIPPDRHITLDVFFSDFVGTIKTMVQDKEHIPPALRENQNLLFDGKKMKDLLTLEESHVLPGSVIVFDDNERPPRSPTIYLSIGVCFLSVGLLLFLICLILCCTSARMT